MYTAILFTVNECGETFTCSKIVRTDEKASVLTSMCDMAHISREEVDTILLVRNGAEGPEVFKHWTAANGDFSPLLSKAALLEAAREGTELGTDDEH